MRQLSSSVLAWAAARRKVEQRHRDVWETARGAKLSTEALDELAAHLARRSGLPAEEIANAIRTKPSTR